MVGLKLLQRVAVHRDGGFAAPGLGGEVGELRGDEITVAGMPAQGYSRRMLRHALAVGGGCVEVVDPVAEGGVNQVVYGFLVDFVGLVPGAPSGDGRPAHAAVAENGYLLTRLGVLAVCHLVGRNLAGGGPFRGNLLACRVASRERQPGGRSPDSEALEEVAASYLVVLHRSEVLEVGAWFISRGGVRGLRRISR